MIGQAMIGRVVLALTAVLALSAPTRAASPQGFNGEKPEMATGKVVDALCALTGDCPADCGGGRRQMGLLTPAGKFYLVAKTETPFAGAVADLLPHCGQTLIIDGLLVQDNKAVIFYLDRLHETEKTPWRPPIGFIVDWAQRNGVGAMSKAAEEWWAHDPTIRAHLAKYGKLGLGATTK